MTTDVADKRLRALVEELRQLPAEAPWAEFKQGNKDPQKIGCLISALSNAARIAEKPSAYLVWGIRDGDHAIVGTDFEPAREKVAQQPLELWLAQRLQPGVAFEFQSVTVDGKRVLLLDIPAASGNPVEFDRTAYIRIGSATPRLSDHPERLRRCGPSCSPFPGKPASLRRSRRAMRCWPSWTTPSTSP